MLIVILPLAMAGTARGQVTADAFAVHPYTVHPYTTHDTSRDTRHGDLAASRFWTPGTIALVTLDGAAKAADSYITRRNIAGGGEEYNPMARPFVHTTAAQVVATGALLGAEIATAYLLHRRRHDYMGRAVLMGGAVMNGLGAASSFRDRVPNW